MNEIRLEIDNLVEWILEMCLSRENSEHEAQTELAAQHVYQDVIASYFSITKVMTDLGFSYVLT